jgi:hypothetical protein
VKTLRHILWPTLQLIGEFAYGFIIGTGIGYWVLWLVVKLLSWRTG